MYGILCIRTGGSVLGAAEAYAKQDGKRMEFESKAEAEIVAQRYNDNVMSRNVHYQVRPL